MGAWKELFRHKRESYKLPLAEFGKILQRTSYLSWALKNGQEFADWRSGERYKVTSKKSQCFLEMAYWGIKSKSK